MAAEWIARVKAEKQEVDGRISKLEAFVRDHGKEVSARQLQLLKDQREVMQQYSNILAERLGHAMSEFI